jgi:hypothetical protein
MVDLALLRKIAGIIFAIIGGIVLLCNYIYLYYRIRYKESPSFAPILGGLFLTIALFLFDKTRAFCWIGLLLDVSIWEIIVCVFNGLIGYIKSKKNNKSE